MSNLAIGFTGLGVALLLIMLRFHIGLALGLVSIVGISAILNFKAALGIITAVPYAFVGDWNLSAIPMFLLMGFVASSTGLTTGLFRAMRMLLSFLPGGLAVASVGASAIFAAASGSSIATSAAMARIATPEMLKYGYHPGLASGVIAASGTLGSLIPPSILLLLYGYFAGASVGQLFIAGIMPGVLSMLLYSGMIVARCTLNPALAPKIEDETTKRELVEALREVWPLPVLILSVLIGIFMGVFTPTQAGAIGAGVAMAIAAVRRGLTITTFWSAMKDTLHGTAGIFLVIIGTSLLTRFLALSQVPTFISSYFIALDAGPLLFILAIAAIFLLLGMFVDSIGLMLLTLPIILPVAHSTDMNLIWLGIMLVKLLEVGLVTPPVGLNVYVIKSALGDKIGLTTIFRGVTWFIAMDFVALALIGTFPMIALYLPGLMQ
ncbi:TRAP transporter large permease [Roseovarius sp.]|uniref:TRAP transporter large permease n=1 Tax=Roseovarius sp. TaxID=1486281 RepID=UPI003563077C